jgi:hypothetical protein
MSGLVKCGGNLDDAHATITSSQRHLPSDFSYNKNRPPPWSVIPVPNRGLASFATRNYSAGEVIFRENPLLWVPFHWPFKKKSERRIVAAKIAALSDVDRSIFWDSANVYDLPPDESTAAGVFYTNSFDMTGELHGVSCGIDLGVLSYTVDSVTQPTAKFSLHNLGARLV